MNLGNLNNDAKKSMQISKISPYNSKLHNIEKQHDSLSNNNIG